VESLGVTLVLQIDETSLKGLSVTAFKPYLAFSCLTFKALGRGSEHAAGNPDKHATVSAALCRILASERTDVALIQEPWLVSDELRASGKQDAS
jgi:hypothetical protein